MRAYYFIVSLSLTFTLNAVVETISLPGIVELGSDISFAPGGSDIAIQITANDVTLDLGGYIVEQTNATAAVSGIEIAAGVSNVLIRNGIIRNFTQHGIRVNSSTTNIMLKDLQIRGCEIRGVSAVGAPGNTIEELFMENLIIEQCAQGATGDNGIRLEQVNSPQLNNIFMNETGVNTHDTFSINLDTVSQGRLQNIRIVETIGTDAAGINANTVDNTLFCNIFVGSSSATNTFFGFRFVPSSSCQFNIFKDCTVFRNSAATCSGFNIGASNINNTLEGCNASHNSSTTGSSIGFLSDSTANNNFFFECIAQSNSSSSNNATGFSINSNTSTRIICCLANDQLASSGIARGIQFANCIRCFLEENLTSRNNGSSDPNSFGVQQTPSSTTGRNVFIKNVSYFNGPTTPIASNQLNGFNNNQRTNNNSLSANLTARKFTNLAYFDP